VNYSLSILDRNINIPELAAACVHELFKNIIGAVPVEMRHHESRRVQLKRTSGINLC